MEEFAMPKNPSGHDVRQGNILVLKVGLQLAFASTSSDIEDTVVPECGVYLSYWDDVM